MNHILIKEPAAWHCLCCSKNFPLSASAPVEQCPVYTLYCETKRKIKELPEIKGLISWNEASAVLINNLELLMTLDEQMSDGLQATKRRFPIS